ncbi:MAG: DUF6968 family protein [Methylocella sp.]
MDIIAQRVLKILKSPTAEVTVSIGRPFLDGQDFKCEYTIEWPEHKQHAYSMGIDAIQALMLALQRLAADVSFSDYAKSKQLVWLEPEGGFGLPLPPDLTEKEVE